VPAAEPHIELTRSVQAAEWPLLASIADVPDRVDAFEATFGQPGEREGQLSAIAEVVASLGEVAVLAAERPGPSRIAAYRGLWNWPDRDWVHDGLTWEIKIDGEAGFGGLATVESGLLKQALAWCLDASTRGIVIGNVSQEVAENLLEAALRADALDIGLLALAGARAQMLVGRVVTDSVTDQIALQVFGPPDHPMLL
jgi:hypothetical protein